MSFDASITIDWADGQHTFRLPIHQLLELQDKTNAGPLQLITRLETGAWRVQDVRETIRLGLIGGGAKPADALKLVRLYVDERPLVENVHIARAVLFAALMGSGERVGKDEAATTAPEAATASPPPPSTEQAPL